MASPKSINDSDGDVSPLSSPTARCLLVMTRRRIFCGLNEDPEQVLGQRGTPFSAPSTVAAIERVRTPATGKADFILTS
jgi:hypothetical protein